MIERHPRGKPNGLVVRAVERMPILGTVKDFHTWNESTVCTVECADGRAGIAIGFSKHGRPDGVATYSSIEDARALIALIELAIADAERIERGAAPIAQPGNPSTH